MNKRPLTFICSACERDFTNLIDTSGEPTVYLHCPYCSAASTADLSPYPKPPSDTYRAVRLTKPPPTLPGWPEQIPTVAQSKKED